MPADGGVLKNSTGRCGSPPEAVRQLREATCLSGLWQRPTTATRKGAALEKGRIAGSPGVGDTTLPFFWVEKAVYIRHRGRSLETFCFLPEILEPQRRNVVPSMVGRGSTPEQMLQEAPIG